MLRSSLICICLLACLSSHGQVHAWSHLFGGADFEWGYDLALAPQGHLYVAGKTTTTPIDMDPGGGTAMVDPPFVLASYGTDGTFRWANDLGGTALNFGAELAAGPDGSVVLAGYNTGSGDLDPGPAVVDPATLSSTGLLLVAKWDPLGNFLWAFRTGSPGNNPSVGAVAIDDAGNILISGLTYDGGDFDPGPDTTILNTPILDPGPFCAKYAPNGNFLWGMRPTTRHSSYPPVVATDGAGNAYLAGCFGDSIDVDPGPDTFILYNMPPWHDIYLAKYDPAGAFVWAGVIGGGNENTVLNIAANASGTVALTGKFEQTCDFDPGPGSAPLAALGTDGFFACYDTDGLYLWAQKLGNEANDVKINDAGTVTGTGEFSGSMVVLGSVIASHGISDVFAARYAPTGAIEWGIGIGGTNYDEAEAIVVDADGSTYLCGSMRENADFDPGPGAYGPPAGGAYDIYLARYDGLSTGISTTPASPSLTPWPVPATGHLNVPCSSSTDLNCEVLDAMGRSVVLRAERSGAMMRLDVHALAPGPYILRWKEDDGMRSARFVRE